MSELSFPINDLFRRKLQTSLIVISLTCSVASTLFLLLFSERIGFGISSVAENILTLGLLRVFSQFVLFICILIFAVGAVIVSFIVFLMMTQRTRDFGLIKAAGCPNSLVFSYFITELLIIVLVCCLLGVAFGFAADFAVANLGGFRVYQKPPDLVLAPLVFAAYFIIGLVFGTKPILDAAKLSSIKAMSPMQYFGISTGSKLKPLSKSGLALRIASRSLFRRKSTTIRIVLLLSIVFILLTMSVAGGIVASDTTQSWVKKALGRNSILIAHDGMGAQYELLLFRFLGDREGGDFDYLDERLSISDAILQQLDAMPGITNVDARLILKEHVQEVRNFTIDPETLTTLPVGDNREGDSLMVGVDPQKITATWFMEGQFLRTEDNWEAVIGDSIAQTMFSQPLVQSIRVKNETFGIIGVCFDPINNGKVTYVPIARLQNMTGASGPNIVFVELATSVDQTVTLSRIRGLTDSVQPGLTVVELDEVLEKNLDFLGSIWSMIMLLPLFTLASATLCLIAYVMLVVDEQRQEFAVLRVAGAKPKTITAILAVQSMIVLLSGCAVGISLGVMTTLLILVPYPVVTGFTILEIAAWLFAALVGLFLLSLIPAAKLAKTSIIKIIN